MKRLISFVLLLTLLVLSFTACNGESDKPVESNGKISEDAFSGKCNVTFWEGTKGVQEDADLNGLLTYDELKSKLMTGGRIWSFSADVPEHSEEISLEDFKRVKFTIEADRNVTVYISAGRGELGVVGATKYELQAGKAKKIEVFGAVNEKSVDYRVVISPTENGIKGEYNYKTEAFKEWYQTNYKITDLEFYTK